MEAVNSDAVASQLLENGVIPININPAKTGASTEIDFAKFFTEKVTDTDIIQFSRQMYSLTKAGVPMLSAMHGLSQSTKNATLAEAIRNVTISLESGRDLATSFNEHPEIFSLFYVSMIRIGETTGQLDEIFNQLARYMERDKRTRNQIKSALRYPGFVLIAISIAIAIINLFVIPSFAGVFSRFGAELPLPTLILMNVSNFSVTYWPELLGILLVMTLGIRHYIRTDNGRYRWDKQKLKHH